MKINRLPNILQYVSTCITVPGRNHDLTNYVSYIIYSTVLWFYGCLSKKNQGKQKQIYSDEISPVCLHPLPLLIIPPSFRYIDKIRNKTDPRCLHQVVDITMNFIRNELEIFQLHVCAW